MPRHVQLLAVVLLVAGTPACGRSSEASRAARAAQTARSPVFGGTCASQLDCSLNGDCVGGRCHCDAAWAAAPQCDVLAIEPMDVSTGYHNATYASWGGNVVFADGLYHLFVAQMELHCPLHNWGSNSAIIRATSTKPNGPFVYQQTIVAPFAHNPTIRQAPDGTFVLFFIGGAPSTPVNCSGNSTFSVGVSSSIAVAWASSVTGPWQQARVNFTNPSAILAGGFTNPSPHFLPNGTVVLAFQAQPPGKGWELVGIATADSFQGPYVLNSGEPVTPEAWWCVAGQDEDPFLWRSHRGWHVLMHGMCPTGVLQAHYAFSTDAIHWTTSPRETYPYLVQTTSGKAETFARVERPQLVFGKANKGWVACLTGQRREKGGVSGNLVIRQAEPVSTAKTSCSRQAPRRRPSL
eukprot:m.122744 g.122744  ORF g.122744 m.122744 type:complete len:407 (-) comp16574_c0_seq2:462-1682(-)